MEGYVRVSAENSNIEISYTLDDEIPGAEEEL